MRFGNYDIYNMFSYAYMCLFESFRRPPPLLFPYSLLFRAYKCYLFWLAYKHSKWISFFLLPLMDMCVVRACECERKWNCHKVHVHPVWIDGNISHTHCSVRYAVWFRRFTLTHSHLSPECEKRRSKFIHCAPVAYSSFCFFGIYLKCL